MKKTTIWSIVAIVIIALGGGAYAVHNSSQKNADQEQFDKYMTQGRKQAQARKYEQASSTFAKAIKLKRTDEALASKEQVDHMTGAIVETEDGEYNTALGEANDVINNDAGLSLLQDYARQLKKTINTVKDNYEHEIKPLLKKAQQEAKDESDSAAIDDYQAVLDLPYINGKYYKRFKKEAKAAIKELNAKPAANTATNKKKPNKDTANSTGTAGTTGEGAAGDHKVNGKTVTNDQLTQIRQQLTSLGYSANSWSPQDLIDLYRSSKHTSPAEITKDDVQSYLSPR